MYKWNRTDWYDQMSQGRQVWPVSEHITIWGSKFRFIIEKIATSVYDDLNGWVTCSYLRAEKIPSPYSTWVVQHRRLLHARWCHWVPCLPLFTLVLTCQCLRSSPHPTSGPSLFSLVCPACHGACTVVTSPAFLLPGYHHLVPAPMHTYPALASKWESTQSSSIEHAPPWPRHTSLKSMTPGSYHSNMY